MLAERMNSLTPYVPGEQPRDRSYVKLNTNENPYPPTPKIAEYLSRFDPEVLRLYPDPASLKLRQAIAEAEGVTADNVFAANGSDELLAFAFYAFFDGERGSLNFPEFTYTFYPVYCDLHGIPFQKIPMKKDFAINLEGFLDNPGCGSVFPNPNAPTGMALSRSRIRDLLKAYPADRVVIVDEAYIDFGAESAAPLIEEFGNLLIARTFSKGGSLAGLRLGYALGQSQLIEALTTVKDSFNSYPVDTLAQNLGVLAVQDAAYYTDINRRICDTRDLFMKDLKRQGWEVLPSLSNFVFTRKAGLSGEDIYLALREKGFLVRYFRHGGIEDFVRITIGMPEDMQALAGAMAGLEGKR